MFLRDQSRYKRLQSRLELAVVEGLSWYHYFWLLILFFFENVIYIATFSLTSNWLRILYIPAIAYTAQCFMFVVFVALLLALIEQYAYNHVNREVPHENLSASFEALVLVFCSDYIISEVIYFIIWCRKSKWKTDSRVFGHIINVFFFLVW